MATLNIKNFPDALYKKLQIQAKRERRSTAQEATQLLSAALERAKPPFGPGLHDAEGEPWRDDARPARRRSTSDDGALAKRLAALTGRLRAAYDRRPVTRAEWDAASGDES